jgi:mannose-6-phosphate isomerase
VRQTLQRQPAGLLPDVVDAADRPLSSGARLWPQLEYLKALVAAGGTARDAADAFAARVMAAYVADMPRGCWCDRVDLAGRRIADRVPASIVYHLFSVVVEAG